MNTKLSRTILSAALLAGAFALAGCGGGDDPATEDPSGMTEAEKTAAAEARAKEAEDKLAAKEEAEEKAKAEADAAAMEAMAKKLSVGISADDTVGVVSLSGSTLSAASFDVNGTTLSSDVPGLKRSDTVVAALAGWNGADYVDTTGSVTNHAVVYSNQGPPKSQAFEEKHDLTNGQIPAAQLSSPAYKITGTGFRTSPGSKTHEAPKGADYVSVRGTFDGAPGSFRCADDTCESHGHGTHGTSLSGDTNGWYFIADDGAMTSTADGDYVMYGWWSRDAGADGVAVAAFADPVGGDGMPPTDITSLSSKATYMGGAAGKVAVYSPVSDSNVAGAFTASVELTADFDGGTDGVGDIEGTISKFSVGGAMQEGWSVALKSSELGQTGAFTGGETEWTVNGAKGGDSTGNTYSGQLYEADADSGLPLTVAGEFTSNYGSVGSMVGAFGAKTSE